MTRLAVAAALALTLAACATTAPPAGAPPRPEPVLGDRGADMAVDLIVVRPLGLVGTVLGAAGFVVALPFTLPSGSAAETAREWVGRPFEYTFNRPLGDFGHCGAERRPCGQR